MYVGDMCNLRNACMTSTTYVHTLLGLAELSYVQKSFFFFFSLKKTPPL